MAEVKTSRREKVIANSVAHAIIHSGKKPSFIASIRAYFWIYWLNFHTIRPDLFDALRTLWTEDDETYRSSFTGKPALEPLGDMGYSGSTFFMTVDCQYLVKSIPRRFENTFFRDDLVVPYAEHMTAHPRSLLIRIHDFLECRQHSLGTLLGTAPSHHIVMENIKPAKESHAAVESWDLKPMSYFYPERDVAGGALATEATKSKLPDVFKDTIRLTAGDAEAFTRQLEQDTALLAQCNAVDYSLFLVRLPASSTRSPAAAKQSSWRTGVASADGKHLYRAAVLDFFWAKHKLHAKAMSGLIRGYNVIDRQGEMSITAEPNEYRDRWLKMCKEIIEIVP